MSNVKLCPFKKGTVKRWAKTLENNETPTNYDVLMPCDGERCMAYRDGECRKIPSGEQRYPTTREV